MCYSKTRPLIRPGNPPELRKDRERQEYVNLEAQIFELLLHLRTLKAGQCPNHDNATTATGMAEAKTDIDDIWTEIRQGLAILGVEAAGRRDGM
ncbi:hypothetical protein [Nonomuraea sp. CA-141351]|uniref:hypothetical protein n=1 Tax=Nonomuraea sp. CA-141351 TaxID=3239996 RepID=UPI003D8C9FB2